MTTSALILMVSTQSLVAIITFYFFFKVLTVKPKEIEEPDEND